MTETTGRENSEVERESDLSWRSRPRKYESKLGKSMKSPEKKKEGEDIS